MNPFKNRTKNQIELLKLKPNDFAYVARMNDTVVPEIVQIKITGECDEGDGYLGLMTDGEPYKSIENKDGTKEWLTSSEIHTCNMPLVKSKKEAKEYAKKLVKNEIKSLKEQQSVISRNIHKFLAWQNAVPTFKAFNESQVFIAPKEKDD